MTPSPDPKASDPETDGRRTLWARLKTIKPKSGEHTQDSFAVRMVIRQAKPLGEDTQKEIWRNQNLYSIEWIMDAVERTITANPDTPWPYMERILQRWQKKGGPPDRTKGKATGRPAPIPKPAPTPEAARRKAASEELAARCKAAERRSAAENARTNKASREWMEGLDLAERVGIVRAYNRKNGHPEPVGETLAGVPRFLIQAAAMEAYRARHPVASPGPVLAACP